ncbi:formin-like [Montipora foliosa]|uniref:formin-like n=1 Tax=Montipora foliosa TaxID=591990 RepID=UPI0035F1EA0C
MALCGVRAMLYSLSYETYTVVSMLIVGAPVKGVFYRVLNHEAKPSGFRPDERRPASLLNGFTNIPQKACSSGVRTKVDNSKTLLHYVVEVYCEKRKGVERGDFLLPDPYAILAASQVSFKDINAELAEAKISLATCKAKAEMVLDSNNSEHKEPFQSFVREYLSTGETELARLQEKVQSTMDDFKGIVEYFQYSGEGEEVTPPLMFGIWGNFLEAFKNNWKAEQINLAKRTFCNADHLKQIRATATKFKKRRKSETADPNDKKSQTKTS